MLSFKSGTLRTLWKTSKTQATRTAHNHERPRRRCFPAEVQYGNGGVKILAAEKLSKAVGRWGDASS